MQARALLQVPVLPRVPVRVLPRVPVQARALRERVPVLADGAGVLAVAGFGADQSRLAQPGQPAYALIFWKKE